MKFPYSGGVIAADIYFGGHRVSCKIPVPTTGLYSLLMDPLSSMLEVTDAYISRVRDLGNILDNYDRAALKKDNIMFVILARRDDGALPRGAGSYLRTIDHTVHLTTPHFEISGIVETEAKVSPSDVVLKAPGRYLPVFNAKAVLHRAPETAIEGKVFLVNRDLIEMFTILPTSS
ncbi:MAG: hypothetical protein ABFQ89_06025 [Chloroflexota bacterium]